MKINRHTLCFLATLLAALFSGCAKKDSDRVSEAQSCLDTATSSTALTCLQKIDGVESDAAYLIRCSAQFIYQDFTNPTRLASISTQMGNTNGASASAVAIGLLSFSKSSGSSTPVILSEEAFTACEKSKSKGMILLASMAKIATAVNAAGLGAVATACDSSAPGYSASACQTSVQSAVCAASPATIGAAAVAAYEQSCKIGSQQQSSVCLQFAAAQAAGNGSPTAVGAALQGSLSASGTCPP